MFRGESRSCRDNRPTCLPYCACNLNLFSQKCKSYSHVFNWFFLDCTYGIANISVHGDQDRVGNEKEGPGGKFRIAFSMEKCSLTMPYSGAWRPNCQWPPCLQSTCPICPFQSFSRSHTFLTNSESGYIREQQHLMYQHLVFTPRCRRKLLTLPNVRLSCRRHWLSCTAYQLLDWETWILVETTPWVTGNWSWSDGNTFSAICIFSQIPFQYQGMYNTTLNLVI